MNIKIKKDFYKKNGYLIFNINDDLLINKVNSDIEKILKKEKRLKKNSKIFSYNESPRIVESYKKSINCKLLAKHPKIIEMLKLLYEEEPLAFSTINFLTSTQQPLHSDYAHFGTIPELLLVGTWIALEDIDPDAGPLQIVPGSHKWNVYRYSEQNNGKIPASLDEIKKQYTSYEQWVKKQIQKKKSNLIIPTMQKGDCIIWSANLLHGSPDCIKQGSSRKSQVTHWAFRSVVKHYNPIFSDLKNNIIVERKIEYI
jgi:ectoine hydroxylase-related dioxygenase (phytanoyl-CoA dioxygenase family)